MSVPWYEVDVGMSEIFYSMEALMTAVMVTNVLQYAWWKVSLKPKDQQYWRPVHAIALAVPLCLMYPIAVVFVYIGKIDWPNSKMWKDGSWSPNVGYAIVLWILRYIGFILLGYGILKITGLDGRIAKKWKKLRNGKN